MCLKFQLRLSKTNARLKGKKHIVSSDVDEDQHKTSKVVKGKICIYYPNCLQIIFILLNFISRMVDPLDVCD